MFGLEPMMILLHLLGSTFSTDLVHKGTNEYASSKCYYILIIYTNIKITFYKSILTIGSDFKMYEDEIIFYLISTVYMQVVCLPQVINYWNMEEDFYNTFIAKRISRDTCT